MQPALQTDKRTMTCEEFLQWADEDTYAEWVDGEVIFMALSGSRHQCVVSPVMILLNTVCELTSSARMVMGPFEVFLPARPAARLPDLIVAVEDRLHNLTDERFPGAPDLVVEVISEDSVHRDRVEKFLEYEREGVREYWLIDSRPAHASVDVFTLEQKLGVL